MSPILQGSIVRLRPAERCYSKVGFKPVGVTRRSERGPDGTWHNGLLMDLLADEFVAKDS